MTKSELRVPKLPDYVIHDLPRQVRTALEEDVGKGDLTAGLITRHATATATIISREEAVVCGTEWVNEVFRQLGTQVEIHWQVKDGDRVQANSILCTLSGSSRHILTGERTALNFLQTLSGTATVTQQFAEAVAGKNITILDTRKTLPGLRTAQKYAVLCGGGQNHRIGLYDAFLIKENHIAACGSITQAITLARQQGGDRKIIVEVETISELHEAIQAKPDQIMLDEFDPADVAQAEQAWEKGITVELSGSFDLKALANMPASPFPICISSGALTKHVRAIDLSLRLSTLSQ